MAKFIQLLETRNNKELSNLRKFIVLAMKKKKNKNCLKPNEETPSTLA